VEKKNQGKNSNYTTTRWWCCFLY